MGHWCLGGEISYRKSYFSISHRFFAKLGIKWELSLTQRQPLRKKWKISHRKKVIGDQKNSVYGGAPTIFFKIGTDNLNDKPSNLAEETLWGIDV